jgi:hypothetical protein
MSPKPQRPHDPNRLVSLITDIVPGEVKLPNANRFLLTNGQK